MSPLCITVLCLNIFESVSCCEAFAGDVLRFFFTKSSWNPFTLRFIRDQPFILQSAVFRLTRREDWNNHNTCSNYIFAIQTLLLFLLDGESISFCQRSVIHLNCVRFGSVRALLFTTAAWYKTLCHLVFDIIVGWGNHINILIPTTFYHQQAFRRDMKLFT